MVTCSNILTWRIPWTEEPGGLVYRVTKGRTRLKRLNTHARVWFKPPFLIPIFFSETLYHILSNHTIYLFPPTRMWIPGGQDFFSPFLYSWASAPGRMAFFF